MIESVIVSPIVLPTNSSQIAFTNDPIRTRSASCCGWLSHLEGSPIYKITKGGTYKINLTANVSSAEAGIVSIGLYRDGILDPSTIVSQTNTAGGNTELSINKKINVCCSANENLSIGSVPSVLSTPTLVATDTVAPTILNANLIIDREC